jgi:enoyl-CoA hydratase/carnithine racemase
MTLHVHVHGPIVELTFDRPDARNALSQAVVAELVGRLRAADQDPVARVVVLTAKGDVFLSGGDLAELATLPSDATGAAQVSGLGRELAALETISVPVIAAMQGDAYGGGAELVLICDLVVMGATASFRFVHRNVGLVPAWGGATRLTERVGAAMAADILFTARPVGSEEALRLGLVSRVSQAPREDALALAEELAKAPREALAAIKRSLVTARRAARGAALEREHEVFLSAWGSAPHQAAMEAFRDRKG